MAQRKDVIRQMIDQILVTGVGDTEQVQVTIKWAGGDLSQAQITRPVAKWTQLSYYPQLCQRLEQLTQANLTTSEIIDCLHQDGFRPPKRRQTFNSEMVQTLIRRLGLTARSAVPAKAPLSPPEWWLPDLAAKLDMPTMTLYNWVQRGWVKAKQQAEPPKHWIIWADEAELERLRTHRQCPNGEILRQRWKGETPSIACLLTRRFDPYKLKFLTGEDPWQSTHLRFHHLSISLKMTMGVLRLAHLNAPAAPIDG